MNFREILRANMDSADMVMNAYLSDLDDKDLLVRPHPECNHIAWQIGHLTSSFNWFNNQIKENSAPALPAGFEERYEMNKVKAADSTFTDSKETLLAEYKRQRQACYTLLETLSEADLDKPAPEQVRAYAPNIAACMILHANHPMMHIGQWAVVRRVLGKPVVI